MNKYTKDIRKIKYQGIQLSVYSGDLYLPYLGGNKARKIINIQKEIVSQKANAIVTTGGIQSNHCRVAALASAQNGWKCVLILHNNSNEQTKLSGNYLIMKMAGAETIFSPLDGISQLMDESMTRLKQKGYTPYYLYGGGHNKPGVEAYINTTFELFKKIDTIPDHIFLASGTGSTQAGILLGLYKLGLHKKVKVHGISVGRNYMKGVNGIKEGLSFFNLSNSSDIYFYDDYLMGGYGAAKKELTPFLNDVAKETGILTDSTYSGKAFYGMIDLIKKESLSGNFLFWHTGGLLNLLST